MDVSSCQLKMRKYSLKKDHAEIKKQIKEWERRVDEIVKDLPRATTKKKRDELINELENISHEMMAVNI